MSPSHSPSAIALGMYTHVIEGSWVCFPQEVCYFLLHKIRLVQEQLFTVENRCFCPRMVGLSYVNLYKTIYIYICIHINVHVHVHIYIQIHIRGTQVPTCDYGMFGVRHQCMRFATFQIKQRWRTQRKNVSKAFFCIVLIHHTMYFINSGDLTINDFSVMRLNL